MTIQPYLFFEGRAEEAAAYYVKHLGAEVMMKMRFNENPDSCAEGRIAPGSGEKIMHMTLKIGGSTVMASDGGCSGKAQFGGVALSYTVETAAEADRIFSALAEGGAVMMPLGETFFSPRFGMVTDRFGLMWMVYAAPKA